MLPERSFQFPLQMHSDDYLGKPAKYTKTSCDKGPKIFHCFVQNITCKQGKDLPASQKRFQLLHVLLFPFRNHLFWYGAVSSRPCFRVHNNNKKVNTQAVTKQEHPKCQAEQHPTCPADSLQKAPNKKLFADVDTLVDRILFCFCIKISIS